MPTYFLNEGNRKASLKGATNPRTIFLGEGNPEAYFFEATLTHQTASAADNCVLCFRGLGNFPSFLNILVQEPNFKNVSSIGILLDAEANAVGRETSLIAQLTKHSLLGQGSPSPVNRIVVYGERRIAAYISPNNVDPGSIEGVVMQEIQTKPEWQCINAFTQCSNIPLASIQTQKTVVQTYISLKSPGMCGAGKAFEARVLDTNDAAYAPLRLLFDPLIIR